MPDISHPCSLAKRLIAVLLVPCLVADPGANALASILRSGSGSAAAEDGRSGPSFFRPSASQVIPAGLFADQAIIARLASASFLGRYDSSAHIGVIRRLIVATGLLLPAMSEAKGFAPVLAPAGHYIAAGLTGLLVLMATQSSPGRRSRKPGAVPPLSAEIGRPARRKISLLEPSLAEKIRALIANAWTDAQIGEELALSPRAIGRMCRQMGEVIRRGRRPALTREHRQALAEMDPLFLMQLQKGDPYAQRVAEMRLRALGEGYPRQSKLDIGKEPHMPLSRERVRQLLNQLMDVHRHWRTLPMAQRLEQGPRLIKAQVSGSHTGPYQSSVDPAPGLGTAVRQARLELDLTQLELASKAGVTELIISDIERGRYKARLDLFEKLKGILGLNPDLARYASKRRPGPRKPPAVARAGSRKLKGPEGGAIGVLWAPIARGLQEHLRWGLRGAGAGALIAAAIVEGGAIGSLAPYVSGGHPWIAAGIGVPLGYVAHALFGLLVPNAEGNWEAVGLAAGRSPPTGERLKFLLQVLPATLAFAASFLSFIPAYHQSSAWTTVAAAILPHLLANLVYITYVFRNLRSHPAAAPDNNLAPAEIRGYERLSEQISNILGSKLIHGGLAIFDGLPGIGKSTLTSFIHRKTKANRRIITLKLDAFTREFSLRKAMTIAGVQEGREIADHHVRTYRMSDMENFVKPVVDFMESAGDPLEERTFIIHDAYVRGSDRTRQQPVTLRRGDILLIEGAFPHYLQAIRSARCPKIAFRLLGDDERAPRQFEERSLVTYANDLDFVRQRSVYYGLANIPTWKKYAAETESAIDFNVDFTGLPAAWTVRPAAAPAADREQRLRALVLDDRANERLPARTYLEGQGYAVDETSHLGDAVAKVRRADEEGKPYMRVIADLDLGRKIYQKHHFRDGLWFVVWLKLTHPDVDVTLHSTAFNGGHRRFFLVRALARRLGVKVQGKEIINATLSDGIDATATPISLIRAWRDVVRPLLIFSAVSTATGFVELFPFKILFGAPLRWGTAALLGLATWLIIIGLAGYMMLVLFRRSHSYRRAETPSRYPTSKQILKTAKEQGIPLADLKKWMILAQTPEELFQQFKAAGLIAIDAVYDDVELKSLGTRVWSRVRNYPPSFPPSPWGVQFGFKSQMVRVGPRTYHVIGVDHGPPLWLWHQQAVLDLVHALQERHIPLISEQRFQDTYGYTYGAEMQDWDTQIGHLSLKESSPELAVALGAAMALMVIVLSGLFPLILAVADFFFFGLPDCLQNSSKITEFMVKQRKMMASMALQDDSGQPDVAILQGAGHVVDVAWRLHNARSTTANSPEGRNGITPTPNIGGRATFQGPIGPRDRKHHSVYIRQPILRAA